jgi:peptidoglycan/xylan/chitin deacetylase (PgdA/CDA1 family)
MKNNSKYLTFLYHEATNNPSDSGFQRNSAIPYKHKVEEFYSNIDIIIKNRKNIITVDKLNTHNNATLLTFDDGGKSALLIAEHLEKYNLKGHFFITTSLIGDKYFLGKDEIIDLYNRGHIIGSHSHSHPNVFKSLDYDKMVFEWSRSKSILEDILNTKIKTCSIPGGDANSNSYLSAKECGYDFIFDSEPVLKTRNKDGIIILGRICPKAGTSLQRIEELCKLKGIKKLFYIRKIKNLFKILIFPLYSRIHNARKHAK